MLITRELIIERIKKNDTYFFYGLYNGELDGKYVGKELKNEVKTVYDQNWGDGNEYYIALEFTNFGMFILLEGYYSSWDSPSWDSVSHAMPYEFKETRYKEATLDYIRDKKIEEVLSEDKPINE
jgi:hypothetical protein